MIVLMFWALLGNYSNMVTREAKHAYNEFIIKNNQREPENEVHNTKINLAPNGGFNPRDTTTTWMENATKN